MRSDMVIIIPACITSVMYRQTEPPLAVKHNTGVRRALIKTVIMEKTVPNFCDIVTVTTVDTGNAQVLKQFIATFSSIFTTKKLS